MIVSVFKDLYKSTDVPFHVPLDKIIKRIKAGTSKELVEAVRQGNGNEKKKLPCILFAGTFNERNSNSLQKHSGLMVLDFDKYPNQQTMLEHLETLKQNPHFVLLFISPSGNGIKGVIKVNDDLTKETHPKVFKEFHKQFNYDYFDIVNSNVDRVCFESYDPNIFVNLEADLFNPILKDEGFQVSERVPVLPITDQDKIISKIMDWNWSKDFREGERNAFIFDIAGAFCEYGISQYNAENYILNNVIIGDFSELEAKTTIKSAYKKRVQDSKYFENYQKIDSIKVDLKRGKKEVIEKHGISEDTFNEIKEASEHDDFWSYTDKNKIKVEPLKYRLFLDRNGFKKYFQSDAQKATWIYISSNKVVETSTEKIKDFVLDYLMQRGEFDVWNYCASFQNLFSENNLSMLDSVELMMLRDTKTKSYIAFENGILEVTKDTAKLIDYIDVDGYVWKSQIIPRDYIPLDDFKNEYATFIKNISNGEPLAIECVIGYLLSTYKNKMNNKAIILNDEVISENPEGGTGKGLFVQGLRQIRKVSILDGKTFDDKKSFPYQTVSPETQVLVFDDVKKNFDFESKFSLVTEGMTLERKNKDAIKLKVEDSPKMVISTNYAIKGEGNSHDRRRFEIEFAQYYGKTLTPYDEFDRQLFDDWDDDDFQRFDNYMVYCLQSYLKLGLVSQNAKNIKMRKFIAETSMEFFEWVKETENVQHNDRLEKSVYFANFTNEYQDFKKWLTNKKFNIWVQKYANFIGAEYNEGNSNGFRWFMIKTDINLNTESDEIYF
jgi:hypothetical protein